MVNTARHRAAKLGVPFDLDKHINELQDRIDIGICELTGIPLSRDATGRRYDAPSLDRIIPENGYVYDNVRIICLLANCGLGPWGEEAFRKVVQSWLEKEVNAQRVSPFAQLAGWPTPGGPTFDDLEKFRARRERAKERHPDKGGMGATGNLAAAVQMAGWVSPTAQDHNRGNKPPRPWDTGVPLSQQVMLGPLPSGSPASTGKRGALNPAFSLWLQGYPPQWMALAPSAVAARSGAQATRSSRKRLRSS
jgi:hypothetical protein